MARLWFVQTSKHSVDGTHTSTWRNNQARPSFAGMCYTLCVGYRLKSTYRSCANGYYTFADSSGSIDQACSFGWHTIELFVGWFVAFQPRYRRSSSLPISFSWILLYQLL